MLTFFGIGKVCAVLLRVFPICFFVQFDNKKPKSTKMYKFFSDKALMFYTKILISVLITANYSIISTIIHC